MPVSMSRGFPPKRSRHGMCSYCKPGCKEFKKVLNLKDSGLVIYLHNNKDEEYQKPPPAGNKEDKIVLHNTTDKDLKKSDYMEEFNKYKTQCFRCNTILQQIRGLLDEIKEIRENEVRTVCQYCKKPNFTGQCGRCHHLVNTFLTTKVKECDQRVQRFDEWLTKVRHILHAILEETNRSKGKGMNQQDLESSDELKKLLLELKRPLKIASHQPRIRHLLDTQSVSSAASIAESQDILEKVLGRLQNVTKSVFQEDRKSGSSSVSLPAIKTVFKVLPKNQTDSGFVVLPPSSEMLPQTSFHKATSSSAKQTHFAERNRRDRDRDRSVVKGKSRRERGDRDVDGRKKPSKIPRQKADRAAAELLESKLVKETHSTTTLKSSKGINKDKSDKESEETKFKGGFEGVIETIAETQAEKDHTKLKFGEGSWPKEPLPEKSSVNVALKEVRSTRHTVTLTKTEQSLIKIEGFEVTKPLKRSKSLVISKALFSVKALHDVESFESSSKDEEQLSSASTNEEDELRKAMGIRKKNIKSSKSIKDNLDIGDQRKKRSKKSKLGGLDSESVTESKKKSKGKKKRGLSDESESDIISDQENRKKIVKKIKQSESTKLLLKLLKQREKEKIKAEQSQKAKNKNIKMPFIAKLPEIKHLKRRIIKVDHLEKGEFFDECEVSDMESLEMITGDKVVKFDPHYKEEMPKPGVVQPLLFRASHECHTPISLEKSCKPSITVVPASKHAMGVPDNLLPTSEMKGVLRYALSNREFINNGYTILPTIKVMRQFNVYRMIPANGKNDWFKRHQYQGSLYYETGEKLAEIDEDGHGRWYYKNGIIALRYYKAEGDDFTYFILHNVHNDEVLIKRLKERAQRYNQNHYHPYCDLQGGDTYKDYGRYVSSNGTYFRLTDDETIVKFFICTEVNAMKRYVVYSSGQEDGSEQETIAVLASFDHSGNGVVYDRHGNVRIKYNQNEGIVMDKRIGPPARWKWHNLNDPPLLKPVFVENYLEHRGTCLDELLTSVSQAPPIEPDEQMLNIEIENLFKEKSHKLLQKFKPFQIKMKALRINEQFSLKVIDQANIYLLFRDGHVSLKLNLGMLLISNEILDTDTTEATNIWTPYDRVLPRSNSVADIKRVLEVTRERSQRQRQQNARRRFMCDYDDASKEEQELA